MSVLRCSLTESQNAKLKFCQGGGPVIEGSILGVKLRKTTLHFKNKIAGFGAARLNWNWPGQRGISNSPLKRQK